MRYLFKFLYLIRLWNFTGPQYIWYASYGSNTLNDRFYCYLRGGSVAGNSRKFAGCIDRSLPIDESPVVLNHSLYFAKRSRSWSDGGVAFVTVESTPNGRTFGKMFLIKKAQLPEILQQENNRDQTPSINFNELLNNGATVVWNDAWYGRLIRIGAKNGHAIITFTHATNQNIFRSPSREYLQTIVRGLRSAHPLANNDLVNYLHNCQGVANSYSVDQLTEIVNNSQLAQQ